MSVPTCRILGGIFLSLSLAALAASGFPRELQPSTARVMVEAPQAGCAVQLDADAPLQTDAQGKLTLADVEPLDHYIHVRCPKDDKETAYFVSPRAGQSVEVKHDAITAAANAPGTAPATPTESAPDSALDAAAAKIKLRELVLQAVQLRAQARFDEAVQELREAAKLDPENSDLHRELGITFLLAKDWKRARIEMLEAIRHDPGDADAHNGLGYALEKLGDILPALEEYRTATRLEPDDPSYREHYLEALAKEAGERQQKKK